MVMFISARNDRILAVSSMTGGDFVHDCSDKDDSMSKEDVLIISTTAEENGTIISTGKLKGDIYHQGAANKASVHSRLRGANIDSVTSRGHNAEVTRARTYYEYIKNV